MAQTVDNPTTEAPSDTDLVAAIQRVLEASTEPLTVSKIRSQLPARFRSGSLEDVLQRQVTASVLYQYPKYRSQQDRFWDRPMAVHVAALVEEALRERPLPLSEMRRKLPAYAQGQAESALAEQVNVGRVHKHPKTGRGGERFGLQPPDPKEYLRLELIEVFRRLGQLGFTREQLRAGALELLHEEEWETAGTEPAATTPPETTERPPDSPEAAAAAQPMAPQP
jgi:hypothetical protein